MLCTRLHYSILLLLLLFFAVCNFWGHPKKVAQAYKKSQQLTHQNYAASMQHSFVIHTKWVFYLWAYNSSSLDIINRHVIVTFFAMVILQTAVHKLSKQFSARWSFEKKNHDYFQIDFILFQVLKNCRIMWFNKRNSCYFPRLLIREKSGRWGLLMHHCIYNRIKRITFSTVREKYHGQQQWALKPEWSVWYQNASFSTILGWILS